MRHQPWSAVTTARCCSGSGVFLIGSARAAADAAMMFAAAPIEHHDGAMLDRPERGSEGVVLLNSRVFKCVRSLSFLICTREAGPTRSRQASRERKVAMTAEPLRINGCRRCKI